MIKTKKKNDNYYTPKWVWKELSFFLKEKGIKRIYEPFNSIYDEKSIESRDTLRRLGFEVVGSPLYNPMTNENSFFDNLIDQDSFDAVVSNIPFSKKKWVIEHLVQMDKPFCILIPPYALCAKYVKKLNIDEIGIVIPSDRIDFDNCKRPHKHPSKWEALFLTYKMGGELIMLKKD